MNFRKDDTSTQPVEQNAADLQGNEQFLVEAIDLGSLDVLEESFTPVNVTGCGCGANCK